MPVAGDVVRSAHPTVRFEESGTIDVLIPAAAVRDFTEILRTRKSCNHLFCSLLGRYRHRVVRASRATHHRLRKQYQPAGQELQRFSFRAEAAVWVDLQMLSLSCHVSMSQIMVWLIVWESRRMRLTLLLGWRWIAWDTVGSPSVNTLVMRLSEAEGLLRMRTRFGPTRPYVMGTRPPPPARNVE